MIKVLEEKQVPRAKITCNNCGSLLEYGNADLYKREDYSVSVGSYIAYKHYFVCPVCGCDVDATWIIRTKSKPIPKKPIKTNPFFGGEKK